MKLLSPHTPLNSGVHTSVSTDYVAPSVTIKGITGRIKIQDVKYILDPRVINESDGKLFHSGCVYNIVVKKRIFFQKHWFLSVVRFLRIKRISVTKTTRFSVCNAFSFESFMRVFSSISTIEFMLLAYFIHLV